MLPFPDLPQREVVDISPAAKPEPGWRFSGASLRKLREFHKWSQPRLAEQLGVTRQCVSIWETGHGVPSLRVLCSLATILNCGMADLFVEVK